MHSPSTHCTWPKAMNFVSNAAGAHQVQRIHQQAADRPEGARAGAGHAVVEAQAQALGPLPAARDGGVGIERGVRGLAEQQVEAAAEHHHRQHLVQPFGRQPVRDDGPDQRSDQRGDEAVAPLPGVEQLAAIEGVAGGRGTEGRAELVGAQHQMGRQAGGEQGGYGQQAAASGDGIDESGEKGDAGKGKQNGGIDRQVQRQWHGKLGAG